ncbi:MAG: COX15/CtaA family protein [Gemmatimonadales bacterium]|nr:COX15/CtaA family protein [Gemmatimonadales bacterium]
MSNSPAHPRLARWCWATLAVTMVVILWGAVVRATGSGAGCGSHWPLCNGAVVPPSPTVATLIEFSHRLTSGVSLLMVVVMLVWSRRVFRRGHPARTAVVVAMIVMLLEAAIGAGLVKFELVADNASLARALTLGAHLLNTLLLLAAIFLAAWWSGGAPPISRDSFQRRDLALVVAFGAMVMVGMTGAVTSLGDTLFPARTLAEGLAQDRDPTAHWLIQLRIWHPVLAAAAGVYLLWLGQAAPRWQPGRAVELASRAITGLVIVQWCVGLATLLLLVPMPLQLTHLLTADLLWLALVWLAAATLADHSRTSEISSAAASASTTFPAPSVR